MKQKFESGAEKQKAYRERQAALRKEAKALRLAHTVTKKGLTVTESVTVSPTVTGEWDKEKYPERRAWEIAMMRVDRAKKYAEMFPQFIHGDDVRFQDLEWQYVNEGIPACRQPEVKEEK